jgi:hypothetical protein
MMLVVPAWKIAELLELEAFAEERHEQRRSTGSPPDLLKVWARLGLEPRTQGLKIDDSISTGWFAILPVTWRYYW